MKILLVSYFFPPYNSMGAIRLSSIVKGLEKTGNEVRILTSDDQLLPRNLNLEVPISPDKIRSTKWFDINQIPNLLLKKMGHDVENEGYVFSDSLGVKAKILKFFRELYKRIFHFPDAQIGWFFYANREGHKLVEEFEPDIIYASASPFTSLLVGKSLANKYDIPMFAELRDLWSDNPYSNAGFITRKLEEFTLKNANLITVTEPLAEILNRKYGRHVEVIQNSFNEDDYSRKTKTKNSGLKSKKIKITYTGITYEGKRNPSILFEAVSTSEKLKERIDIDFYGRGNEWLIGLAKQYGLENLVNIHPPVSRGQAIDLQCSSDILLLLIWDDPRAKGVYTGKLFEYIGAKKPILSLGCNVGIAADVVRSGFGVTPCNREEVLSFLHSVINGRFEPDFSTREIYELKYQVSKLECFFNKIISGN